MNEKEPSYDDIDLIKKLKENTWPFAGFATAFKEHILQKREKNQKRLKDMSPEEITKDKADLAERVLAAIQKLEPNFSEENFTFERAREIVCNVFDIPDNDDDIVEIK